jgi:hypothetical protein
MKILKIIKKQSLLQSINVKRFHIGLMNKNRGVNFYCLQRGFFSEQSIKKGKINEKIEEKEEEIDKDMNDYDRIYEEMAKKEGSLIN